MNEENTALITDITLIETNALIEEGIVTPSTLFAANSLVQAFVLHDKVILGTSGLAGMSHSAIDNINFLVGNSVARKPQIGEFVDEVSQVSEDAYSNLLYWVASEHLVANLNQDSEINHFSLVLDYLRTKKLSDLTDEDALTKNFGIRKSFGDRDTTIADHSLFNLFNDNVISKGGTPISVNDLYVLRDLAWIAAGGYMLSRCTNSEVYHSLLERPFYASELKRPEGPLNLVNRAVSELDIEEIHFDEVKIPPFLGLIFSDKLFHRKDFYKLILESRERHEQFRNSISHFNRDWKSAKNIGDQRRLIKDQKDAWDALMQKEEHYANERITYFLGRWAASFKKAIMEDLIRRDQYNQRIDKVGGLVKLWYELQDIIPTTDGRAILSKHFENLPTISHWEKVSKLLDIVNSSASLNKTSL